MRLSRWVIVLAGLAGLVGACPSGSVWAAAPDPDFVFIPEPAKPKVGEPAPPSIPPPTGYLNGPCGLTVDSSGRFYVSDYYHDAVDVFPSSVNVVKPWESYVTQLIPSDSLNGPCGLALDASNNLYVNDYHRNVAKYGPLPSFAVGPIFDSEYPTGVAVDPASGDVYVNNRTYVSVYDSSGFPVDAGGQPLKIGEGTLEDGYGLAYSLFPGTLGRLYVPDASTGTVKVYDPVVDVNSPVATITGTGTPKGEFVSLRDSAIAVDRVSGEVYVADNLQPTHTERPQATIHVFTPTNVYAGHLKYNIVNALPPGLAVDNSTKPTQGRVYVTSGNTHQAGVYAYPPRSKTFSDPLPPSFPLGLSVSGSGDGLIVGNLAGVDCSSVCEEEVRSGAEVSLRATPDAGSAFMGWSGEGCDGTGVCTVQMNEARTVKASFEALSGPLPPGSIPGIASRGTYAAATLARGAGASAIAQKGSLRVDVSGKLLPRRLPRRGTAPISVSVGGRISTTDASLPPQLKGLRIEINRHGRFDYAGLPTCQYNRIQPGSSARALSTCRSALVGKGSFTANIILVGQEPYPTGGRLLVFNGTRAGKPVLYGHIFSPRPFATSFVLVFTIERLRRGTYGTMLNAPLPKSMDAWGRITGLQMTLSRRYSYRGARRSYISAGCPAPKGFRSAVFPLVRASFAFDGGKRLSSVLSSVCRAQD
jgi:Divergent InlB B-repeat domain